MKNFPWKLVVVAAIILAEIGVLSWVTWGARSTPTVGLAVGPKTAAVSSHDQHNVIHSIAVDRVLAPVNGWVIVQADWGDGVPDAVLGSQWVPAGESRNLTIQLDPLMRVPGHVFITLLADLGQQHVLEFDVPVHAGTQKLRNMSSTVTTAGASGAGMVVDKPIIAGGKEVSAYIALSPLTFNVGATQASLSEATRTIDATTVVIPRVVAPAQSWVSVSIESTGGTVTQVLAARLVQAGETTGVVLPLSQAPGARRLVARLHVDLGTVGKFDYSPSDTVNSYDQPYVAGGQTVSVPIRVVPAASTPRR